MRQGSLQRGGSILKKGVIVDPRTFTHAKNYCSARSSYGGRYSRLLGNPGREDTPQRRLARSSCSFSQPVAVEK